MADYGAKFADRKIRKVDRQLQAIYRQAERELREKLADFVRRSEAQNKLKRKQVDAGIITEKEYQDWLKGQVFQKKRWESKVKSAQEIMHNHNEQAARIIHQNKVDVYNENYLYQQFEMESTIGMSFDIYSEQAVAKLIKDREQLLPEWKIDEEKDYKWNYRKVNNAVAQGIIQGESVDRIMDRLTKDLGAMNESKMRMFARTAITGAQNAGRQQQMEDAEKEFGIKQLKKWMATLDSRTRDAHRHLDGQEVAIDQPFQSDLGAIRFPGDPTAAPANVYNCRCTMITVYPEYQKDRSNWRDGATVDGMSYEEWKEGKKKAGNLAFVMSGDENSIYTDIAGAETSHGNWQKLTEMIEYGELFDEAAVKITEDTLNKLYDEYPLSEPMGIVGDTRIIRNLDPEADGLDLTREYGFGAHYLNKRNQFIKDGKAGIEVLYEGYSNNSLLSEFRERHELRKRYGYATKATAFDTSSSTLEGTIMHEYAHAIQEEYGLYGGSRSEEAMIFSGWLYKYLGDNKEDVRQISNYATDHPFEMMAEAFVQIHDIEHTDTIAYKVAREIWDEFEDYRLRRGRYAK